MVDYQKYGIMEIWGAGKFSPPHRGYQLKEDAIWVFLNYEKVGVFKDKDSAQRKVNELINDCPVDLKEFVHYLILD